MRLAYVFFLLACVALGGCSVFPRVQQEHQKEVRTLLAAQMRPYQKETPRRELHTETLPLAEIYTLAVKANISRDMADLTRRKNRVDYQQAQSSYWPRFALESYLEFPFEEDDFDYSEGISFQLLLKYNFLNAIFAKDKMSVENLKTERSLQEIAKIEKDLFFDLVEWVVQKESITQTISTLKKQLKNSQEAIQLFSATKNLKRNSDSEIRKWEAIRNQCKLQIAQQKNKASGLQFRLNAMLGHPSPEPKGISDASDILRRLETIHIPQSLQSDVLNQIANQSNELKMAQIDLLLSKMAIEVAKQEALPKLWFSLGVGKVDLEQGDSSSASVVPALGMSYDLFDMGDQRRRVEKAQTNHQLATRKLALTAKRIFEKSRSLLLDIDSLGLQKKFHTLQLHQSETILSKLNALSETGLIQGGEFITVRHQALQAQIQHLKARREYQQAVIQLLKLTGRGPEWARSNLPSHQTPKNTEGNS